MVLNKDFWKNKKVFISGHTGFKGSWMSLWLSSIGSNVIGYSLAPPTKPSLFELAHVEKKLSKSIIADIRDLNSITNHIKNNKPDIVIHMAAQPLVRDSYKNPIETYSTNIMGTANLLEAIRVSGDSVRVFLNVTTDKVYENKEWNWAYRENERLGGYDPYSNSKGCSELITTSYTNSFFNPVFFTEHKLNVATARAGNVIGGGDFATDRLIPDLIRSILRKEKLKIRNPYAIRPWQHVLEPISGYLTLVEKMYDSQGKFNGAWNFGPNDSDTKTVEEIIIKLQDIIVEMKKKHKNFKIEKPEFEIDSANHPHEAHHLKLDISKVKSEIGWIPRWNLDTALLKIIEWSDAFLVEDNMEDTCLRQIQEYSF